MERVCHLTNKIYREILCITRHERPGMTDTTIQVVGLDHVQVSAFSWNSRYRLALSWDFLDWMEGIPCFFTNFITTPELSGPLYISPDIYHTQITEYLLERIHQWALFFLCFETSFLIVLFLDPSPVTFTFSIRSGALGNTFPVLFPLK